MQILQISLYGKNGERRDVRFELGRVNIITGASKKGKTSLIDIVEYCLGASECSVAQGYIRKTVDWYSVLLQFPDCQVFIARAAPLAGAKATSAAHMLVGKEVVVPAKHELRSSTNIDSVEKFLTAKIGIPEQVTEVPAGQTRSEFNLKFRHSRYYLFQSQNEIANNDVLFHQQAKPFVPQGIKDTLPYFIGAAEDGRLSDVELLRSLKRNRTQLVKQLREVESLKGEGLQKGFGLLAEAADLGLVGIVDLLPNESQLVKLLQGVAEWSPKDPRADASTADPLMELEREHRALMQKRSVVKLRLRQAQEYVASEAGFEDALSSQVWRLRSVGLFDKFQTGNAGAGLDKVFPSVTENIKGALRDLENRLENVTRTKPRVAEYVGRLREEQTALSINIRRTRQSIASVREQDHELALHFDLNHQRARLAGKVSLYLESLDWSDDSASLANQIRDADEHIQELSDKLDPDAMQDKLNAQLSCIAEDMTEWAKELKLEHCEHRIKLDPKKLTVVAETPYGPVPLSTMGSGENWVGYHLVTYMALAKWFIEQSRPVGRFLFFDQPTQVYYPADAAESGKLSEIERDEDREAVKRMYRWIFQIVESLSPHLQVIITDHADIDEDWFQDAVMDKKWRGDVALIPKHWYE